MRFTSLTTKTVKDSSQADVSRNAQLLLRGGYVDKLMAGVYTYLPLGCRVLSKIENIVREEMNKVGGQEVLMPALQPREIWDTTERWDKVDVLFKLMGAGDRELALGPTHEEVVTPTIGKFIQSYRDLPKAVYQIQTKFRNEPRAKSGLLRGREFRMKDLYSFHVDQASLDAFYEEVTAAYHEIYRRCGIGDITLLTYAGGGIFSKYSHEFQTITEYGEDTIYRIPGTDTAVNKEIVDDEGAMADLIPNYKKGDEKNLEELKAIEVGNIFKLGTRFTSAFGIEYADEAGAKQPVLMGCYGLGPSRVMGTIAEVLSDDKGLVWPDEVAPYHVHLVSLCRDEADIDRCENLYNTLCEKGVEVLYDDRAGVQAGAKLADADLIGIPRRVVVSPKTLKEDSVEFKPRSDDQAVITPIETFISVLMEKD
ncbi:MAG TPA: His/Gly/Thr/Pro-type tRNA ligase C-terminal domain-containing protein [Alphaproteobacteria bacterium]|nr:His/Gly/Thr/Pro-type tRNA ligase C-terminal domain-containing protein [Alphaproteobacteria bacterium]HNS44572.1 His/Gly/Thr/Pro-type tRNA ligase C-terminal domain-containing protein [Alphaproteobacteria bacterium]